MRNGGDKLKSKSPSPAWNEAQRSPTGVGEQDGQRFAIEHKGGKAIARQLLRRCEPDL